MTIPQEGIGPGPGVDRRSHTPKIVLAALLGISAFGTGAATLQPSDAHVPTDPAVPLVRPLPTDEDPTPFSVKFILKSPDEPMLQRTPVLTATPSIPGTSASDIPTATSTETPVTSTDDSEPTPAVAASEQPPITKNHLRVALSEGSPVLPTTVALTETPPQTAPTPVPPENKAPTQPTPAPTTEAPASPVKEPSNQSGEVDFSKMSQEELKKLAENSVRMIASSGRGENLPLTARVDGASESGVVNYFVGAIVLDGAKSIEMTTPGLPEVDGEGGVYRFKATLIPILLQNSGGQFVVTQMLLPENYIVNYTFVDDHIEPSGSKGTLKTTPLELLTNLKPNIQHRFDLITKVNPSQYTDRLKNFPDTPDTPFNDSEGIKTRFSLISNFGARTEEFFAKFESGDLEGAKKVPWIGPVVTARINTP